MSHTIGPGSRVGQNLLVERELGRGAFGTVWLARDLLLDRPVALKFVGVEGELSEEETEHALREARLISTVHSPHVVTLYRASLEPGLGWVLEMEYMDGGTLEQKLGAAGALPRREALPILLAVASGLAAAHSHDLVHGDLKPANVLLDSAGQAKIADFGLGRALRDASFASSEGRELVGTPHYMAPEILLGERPGFPSDIWSLGVLGYRMLSGRLPFASSTFPGLFHQVVNVDPPPLEDASALGVLLLRCLAKSPADRPPSCATIVEAMKGPESVRPPVPAEIPAAAAPSPPIGRKQEIRQLEEQLESVLAGADTLTLLIGEAGAGKSTLLRHLAATARRRGAAVIETAFSPTHGLLRPLLDATRDFLGKEDGDFALERAWLGREGSRDPRQAQALAGKVLESLARRRPVVLILEDGHHADAGDVRALRELWKQLRGARVMVSVAMRPFDPDSSRRAARDAARLHEIGALAGVHHIDLGPMAPSDLLRVIDEAIGAAWILPSAAARLFEVAGGNPLFAIQMVHHLLETGSLLRRGSELIAGPGLAQAALPPRLRELVAFRLRNIAEEDRALLDVAAVTGAEFDGATVAEILDLPLLKVLRRLQGMVRGEALLLPHETGFRFSHPLLQEVIYREIGPELRRALHQKLAERIEAAGGNPDPARLGIHWERAGCAGKAAPYLERAAMVAAQHQEYVRAVDFATRSGLLPHGPPPEGAPSRAELIYAIAGCLCDIGRHAEAEALLEGFSTSARALGDSELELRTAVWKADLAFLVKGAATLDEKALERAARILPAGAELGRARFLLGSIAKYSGNLAEAERWLTAADEVFTALGNVSLHATAVNQLASVALRAGKYERAEDLYGQASKLNTEAGRRTNAAVADFNRCLAAMESGRFDGLEEAFEQGIRTFTLTGAFDLAAHAMVHRGILRYGRGDRAGAERDNAEALRQLERSGYVPGLVSALSERLRLAAGRGSLAEASDAAARLLAAADRAGDRAMRAEALVATAHLRLLSGDAAGEVSAMQEAIATACELDGDHPRAGLLLHIAEHALQGPPGRSMELAAPLLDSLRPEAGDLQRAALALHAAARAPAKAAPPLREAAATLRALRSGERREEMSILAQWLDAEAAVREGAASQAEEGWRSVAARARALGHVWLELAAVRRLQAATGDPAQSHRVSEILGSITPCEDTPSARGAIESLRG